MTTVEKTRAIDPEVLADLEAVCNTKGIVRDPKLLRRITELADQVRQETLRDPNRKNHYSNNNYKKMRQMSEQARDKNA